MNSLEFIEKEIEFLKDMINMDLALVEDDFDLQEIRKKQNRLRHLQQIKAELEAWEVVKNHEFEIDRLNTVAEYYVVHVWKPLKPDELCIVKKALGDK